MEVVRTYEPLHPFDQSTNDITTVHFPPCAVTTGAEAFWTAAMSANEQSDAAGMGRVALLALRLRVPHLDVLAVVGPIRRVGGDLSLSSFQSTSRSRTTTLLFITNAIRQMCWIISM